MADNVIAASTDAPNPGVMRNGVDVFNQMMIAAKMAMLVHDGLEGFSPPIIHQKSHRVS
jgi:hypothetical protein